MEDSTTAVADSAPVAEAAPTESSEAATPADVTHGDTAEQTTDTEPAADTPEPDDGDDAETEPSEGDSPEEAKSKAQKRRERQRQREQERIDRAVAEAVAQRERERETAEQQRQQTEQAAKAREEREKALAQYKGEPGEVERLQGEVTALHKRTLTEIATLTQDDVDQITADIAQRETRLQSIAQAQAFEGEIRQDLWNGIEKHVLSVLNYPEAADPAVRQQILTAEGGIAGVWATARGALVAMKDAERDTALKAQADKHAVEMKAAMADRDAWRVRAGGAEAADMTSGGAAATAAGELTPARYQAMDPTDRMKLRQTPEGRAKIDAMTRKYGRAS